MANLELSINRNPKVEPNPSLDHMAGIVCDMNNKRSGEELASIINRTTKDGQVKVGGKPFAHLAEENGRKMLVFSSPYNDTYSCRQK